MTDLFGVLLAAVILCAAVGAAGALVWLYDWLTDLLTSERMEDL